MSVTPSSIQLAQPGEEDAVPDAELPARIASGPGFWTDWLAELDRQGLLEELLASGVIARALAEAPAGHRYDRTLTAKMTIVCVLVACLFPGAGYDSVLATAFGLPGLNLKPGTGTPTGAAFSQARKLLGEQVMKRLFELDAAVADADLGIGLLWKELEVTAVDGTTMELAGNDVLAGEFGTPADGAKPLLRITAHVRTATFRWIGAAAGGYHDGENALADQLEASFGPGILNLADRGFFSMDRFLRFSARGAHLAWRVKNSAKSVPLRVIRTLPDGSELVMLHESDGMRTRRRRETGDPHAERLPDTTARLVTFTILTETRSGRRKTTQVRVLTTLLDHEQYPAREIAVLYSERWQIEIAFLHLKKTVRGARRALRGQSPDLARQEAWALLLIHNITATATARAAATAGIDPALIPFTAVFGLVRAHIAADTPCRHCGHRPTSANDPLASLSAAILALPRHRPGRQRTSGRTAAERRTRHTEDVTYTIEITKSNLPEMGHSSGNLRAVAPRVITESKKCCTAESSLVLTSDLDITYPAANNNEATDTLKWRVLTFCSDARSNIESDIVNKLADATGRQLQLVGLTYALLHGMATMTIVAYSRGECTERLEDLAAKLNQDPARKFQLLINEKLNRSELVPFTEYPLLRVHFRWHDRPGAILNVLDSLSKTLADEFPSINELEWSVSYARARAPADGAAVARLTLRIHTTPDVLES